VTVAIQQELEIPPRFIGTGEEPEQFDAFSRSKFVEQVL
jgi:signal recognition particle GTPase